MSSGNHDEAIGTRGSASKAKLGAIRSLISTPSKFRNSLKKRRSGSLSRDVQKSLALPIVDVRDAKDQHAVEELRKELIARNLLPLQHDDYHVLLRFVPYDSFLGVSSCIKILSNANSVVGGVLG